MPGGWKRWTSVVALAQLPLPRGRWSSAELSWLRDAFRSVVGSGRPRLVTLVGSAGIGKSRLARALLGETAERATAVVGRCLPYGEGITYWPLTEIVRRLAERPDEAAIAELAGGGAEGARVASRVARAVGFSPGSVAVEEAHWAVRRLLEIQAARRPLIVAIDDLHWAEPTLLDLIEQLATSTAEVPLLAVFLARPELLERRPDWGELGARSTVVPLGPLGADEAAALVERLSGEAVEPDERDVLLATAEGNPFFLEQMVARRAETGVVSAGLPETIQALLAARIDSLSPAERAVVDRAAIEGRTFHRGAVAELLPSDERAVLDAGLAALVRRQLIRQSEAELPGEVGYRFGHALVRDVAYELLAKTMRADLHEAYATWLEHQVDGYAEIVGYHLEQAHRCHAELHPGADAERRPLARRAATRLGTAGRAAVDRGDLPGGVNLLRRATTLQPDDEPARRMLVPELGIALVQLGRLSQADDVLTAAAGRAGADNEKVAEAHALIARFFARVQVDSKAAATELNERFEAFEDAFANAGDELGLTRLWRARALVHWIAGHSTQAESAWERAVTYARRAGDEQGRTEAMAWLASAACEGPTPVTEAIPRCEAILEQLQADRRSQAHTMRPLASLHAMAGSLDRSRELFDRANAILHDLGVGLTSAAPQDEAFVAMLVGDATAAETALRHGYQRLSEMGERALLATTAAMLAQALYLQGSLDEALEFAEAAQAAAAVDDLSAQILARTARAQVLGCRGETTAADRLSGEAVALALQTDWLNYQADTLMVRAAVLRAADEPEQAATAVRAAVVLYERKGNVMAANRARAAVTDDLNQPVRLKR